MNDRQVNDRGGRTRELGFRLWQQLPLLVVLVALWMLLWGSLSVLTIVTGIVLALAVTRVFYLPPVELSGRFNVFWFAVFIARFGIELVAASFQVAWQAVSPRGVRQNAVIAVPLETRSDFIVTLTSISIALIPGSLVVEIDRENSVVYLHALAVRNEADVEANRRRVLEYEARIVRALGSRDDVERMRS